MEYYPRKIEEKMDRWIKRREVILLKGPRQSGKTTLLLHLKEKHGGNYVTLEDEEMLATFEKTPKEFVKRFLNKKRTLLFIDEAQYCREAGRRIKFIFDMFSDRVKLFVTGSGSFDIKVEIGKYLVGRAIYFELLPLDFEEFLMWKAKDLHRVFVSYKDAVKDFVLKGKRIDVEPAFRREFITLLQEYVRFGGFPAVVKEGEEIKNELLKNLVRTYVEKDVFFFLGVRHMEKFREMLKYLSFNTSSLLEISSLMRELGMDYRTIDHYLSILLNTYIISLLPPFHRNLSTELKKAKKVYFTDTGLRNSLINNFLPLESRTDKGGLLENFVLNELKASFDCKVKYWRTTGKAEVDFVLNFGETLIPVEVKSQAKFRKGFLSFLKTYRPERALVFTEREFGTKNIGHTKVAFVPHFFV